MGLAEEGAANTGRKGCSFQEARKLATTTSLPAKTSVAAVRTAVAKSPSTVSELIQTDLTWPLTVSYSFAIYTANYSFIYGTSTTESLTTNEQSFQQTAVLSCLQPRRP